MLQQENPRATLFQSGKPVPVVVLVVRHRGLHWHVIGGGMGRRRSRGRGVIVGVGPVDALRALGPPLRFARLGLLQLLLRLLQLLRVRDHWRRLLLLHVLIAARAAVAAAAAVRRSLGPRRRRKHRRAGFVVVCRDIGGRARGGGEIPGGRTRDLARLTSSMMYLCTCLPSETDLGQLTKLCFFLLGVFMQALPEFGYW